MCLRDRIAKRDQQHTARKCFISCGQYNLMVGAENELARDLGRARCLVFLFNRHCIAASDGFHHRDVLLAKDGTRHFRRDIQAPIRKRRNGKAVSFVNADVRNCRRLKKGREQVCKNAFTRITLALQDDEALPAIVRHESVAHHLPNPLCKDRIAATDLGHEAVKSRARLRSAPINRNEAGEEKRGGRVGKSQRVEVEKTVFDT